MATIKACLGRVSIGATPTIVGELRGYSVDEQSTSDDVGAMGSCDVTYAANVVTATAQLRGHFDAADAGQALLLPGTNQDVVIQPEGQGAALSQIKMTGALITGLVVSAEYGGRVEFQATAQSGAADRTAQT